LFEESLRSPLIIQQPGMAGAGRRSEAISETIDIFPTLCELTGLPLPGFLDGQSLVPAFANPEAGGGSAIGYQEKRITIRTPEYRLIEHSDGFIELYDRRRDPGETTNVAEAQPEVVAGLRRQIDGRMKR
jgi:iduronate 2-sulfatase